MVEIATNYWDEYWHQKANRWVSASVLAGGLLSALILFFLARVELGAEAFAVRTMHLSSLTELNQPVSKK
jgi:hypothetical protein